MSPKIIFRWWSDNLHFRLLYRMDEGNLSGMEADSSIAIASGGSILQVPLDMKAHGCKLGPYLMVASSVEVDGKKKIVV